MEWARRHPESPCGPEELFTSLMGLSSQDHSLCFLVTVWGTCVPSGECLEMGNSDLLGPQYLLCVPSFLSGWNNGSGSGYLGWGQV